MKLGSALAVGMANVPVITPSVVIRPTSPPTVVNQRAPSGPAVIPVGVPVTGYSVRDTALAGGTVAPSTSRATSRVRRTDMGNKTVSGARRQGKPLGGPGTPE